MLNLCSIQHSAQTQTIKLDKENLLKKTLKKKKQARATGGDPSSGTQEDFILKDTKI